MFRWTGSFLFEVIFVRLFGCKPSLKTKRNILKHSITIHIDTCVDGYGLFEHIFKFSIRSPSNNNAWIKPACSQYESSTGAQWNIFPEAICWKHIYRIHISGNAWCQFCYLENVHTSQLKYSHVNEQLCYSCLKNTNCNISNKIIRNRMIRKFCSKLPISVLLHITACQSYTYGRLIDPLPSIQ